MTAKSCERICLREMNSKNCFARLTRLLRNTWLANNNCSRNNERYFYKTSVVRKKDSDSESKLTGSAASKYEIFVDEKSPIIFDIEQEREKFYEINDESGGQGREKTDFLGISPERGVTGVIEIQELVDILKRENAFNTFVIEVPKVYCYVDYMVITSGRSQRHMKAIAEFVRRVYKYKTSAVQGIPVVEGENSKDWLALDLGNIALHVMSESARLYYDLESLWSLNKEYDSQFDVKENIAEIDYASILSSLSPNS